MMYVSWDMERDRHNSWRQHVQENILMKSVQENILMKSEAIELLMSSINKLSRSVFSAGFQFIPCQ